jgi:hypothetical protein
MRVFLRNWLIGPLWLAALSAAAQPGREPGLPGASTLSPEEGLAHLEDFRHARLKGDFCIRFDLIHYPRGKEETHFDGIAWGTWTDAGPLTRFQIRPADPKATIPPDPVKRDANTWEWLVQNGPKPHVWVLAPGATSAREIPPAEWRQPLFPGTVYSPFDLLLPFVYWDKFEYEGPKYLHGRVTDYFVMLPPAGGATATPTDKASTPATGNVPVRIALDRTYKVLIRADQLDAQRKPLREFQVLGLTPIKDEWTFTQLDLLDTAGRDHDRFDIMEMATGLHLDSALFTPARLATPVPLPANAIWTRL